jgi:uncharacterized protein YggU (UPF0235/DUF167 family)
LLSAEFGSQAFDESEITQALDESGAGAAPTDAAEPRGTAPAPPPAGGGTRSALVNVKVIPYARTNELVSLRSDGITVQVTCGPDEGLANKAVLDAIAQALQVRPYQLSLIKGHYKPSKVVQIAGIDQNELDAKLSRYS